MVKLERFLNAPTMGYLNSDVTQLLLNNLHSSEKPEQVLPERGQQVFRVTVILESMEEVKAKEAILNKPPQTLTFEEITDYNVEVIKQSFMINVNEADLPEMPLEVEVDLSSDDSSDNTEVDKDGC